MADEKLPFSEGEEEEFNITDDDIDRELADFDDESDESMENDTRQVDPSDVAAPVGGGTQGRQGFFSKLKALKLKHWVMILIAFIVLYFTVARYIGGSSKQNFDDIQPVAAASEKQSSLNEASLQLQAPKSGGEVKSPQPMTFASDKIDRTPVVQKIQKNEELSPPVVDKSTQGASHVMTPEKVAAVSASPSQHEIALANQIQKLQENNAALAKQVTELTQKISQVGTSVSSLNTQFGSLDQKFAQAQAMKQQSIAQESNAAAANSGQPLAVGQKYFVEAVVPDRAWLQSKDGKTITVTKGDAIPGFGRVVSIDVYSGDVLTSSGKVVQYSSEWS